MSNHIFGNHKGQGLVEIALILALLLFVIFILLPGAWEALAMAASKVNGAKEATDNGAVQAFLNTLPH
jgi:hypothetical protein